MGSKTKPRRKPGRAFRKPGKGRAQPPWLRAKQATAKKATVKKATAKDATAKKAAAKIIGENTEENTGENAAQNITAASSPVPLADDTAGAGRKDRGGGSPGEKRRRSFSQANLEARSEGPQGAMLAAALAVPRESGYRLTHAFHPYPGRFHPALPRTVLRGLLQARRERGGANDPAPQVFDPFVGGGTTLVEAMLLGLPATGNDLNPVAVMVARERTRTRDAAEAAAVEAETRRIAEAVEALRREKNPPRANPSRIHRLTPHYQPHLLAELMQWLRLIGMLRPGPTLETLRAVFSSAVVKFSNLTSDSRPEAGPPPRYPKGAVTRFLVGKCRELTRAQTDLGQRLPPKTPRPVLLEEDARLLPSVEADSISLTLTSPPYPGIYDYHHQHQLRMDWLELDGSALLKGEVGSRREAEDAASEAADAQKWGWSAGLRDVLGTLARVTRPGGRLVLAMGDWISNGHAVDARNAIGRTVLPEHWSLDSSASIRRAEHSRLEKKAFGRRGKWEHLLLFTRGGEPPKPPKPPGPPPSTGKRIRGKTR